jgi:uncharacterized iron-regulated protein
MPVTAGCWLAPATGRRLDEPAALSRLAAGPVALLGETHDRAADHLWQARVVAGLADRGDLAVGLEMLPRRAQPALDAWVAGALDEAGLLAQSRWSAVWGFDPGLYMPILRLCRDRRLPIRALNLDRPIVSLVGRDGWAALPAEERAWLSPAAAATPAYRRYLFEITGGARPGRTATSAEDPAFDRFVRAQQTWDRAFACAIAATLAETPGRRVAALIGRGHLEYGFGTPAQLVDLGIAGATVALPGGGAADDRRPVADLVFLGPQAATTADGRRRP